MLQVQASPLLLLILSLATGLFVWWRVHRWLSRYSATGDPTCGRCGYIVRGVSQLTCPECGSDLREVGIRPATASGQPPPNWLIAVLAMVILILVFGPLLVFLIVLLSALG